MFIHILFSSESQLDISTKDFVQLRRKQQGSNAVAGQSNVAEVEHVIESTISSSATDKKRKRDAPAASASLEDFVSFSSAYDATEHRKFSFLDFIDMI